MKISSRMLVLWMDWLMINHYVSISLKEQTSGDITYVYNTNTSIGLGYPCPNNKHQCTPYILEVERGNYLFECWGSAGAYWTVTSAKSTPGYGGYTSGILTIKQKTTFYIYVGSIGFFNAV